MIGLRIGPAIGSKVGSAIGVGADPIGGGAAAVVYTLPVFQALGAQANSTGAISVVWPTHLTNDIGVLIAQTITAEACADLTGAGWTQFTSSPQAAATGPRLTAYWRRAASAAEANVAIADAGDHVVALIFTIRGCPTTGSPINVEAGDFGTIGTTCTWPTVTTTLPKCLVVLLAANNLDSIGPAWSAESNAALTDLTERADAGTSNATGGGYYVATAEKTVAGVVGATTATVSNSVTARITAAFLPIAT